MKLIMTVLKDVKEKIFPIKDEKLLYFFQIDSMRFFIGLSLLATSDQVNHIGNAQVSIV